MKQHTEIIGPNDFIEKNILNARKLPTVLSYVIFYIHCPLGWPVDFNLITWLNLQDTFQW